VMEFFFYGCSHCNHLHPALSAWQKTMPKDVELVFVPAVFRDTWEPMAYTYYALESMGQEPKLRDALYNAWNKDNIQLFESEKIADFVASRGVDRQKFLDFYNSFAVQSEVKRAKQMIRDYNISGTPTLIVDGKFVIEGLQPKDEIRVLNDVIVLARESHIAPPAENHIAAPAENKGAIAVKRKEPAVPQSNNQSVYTVVQGDTLSAIALRELGHASRAFDLKTAAGREYDEASARKLQLGTKLVIPAELKSNSHP
jgi:protein dithiol oxidoreductase (disulfide-forming)